MSRKKGGRNAVRSGVASRRGPRRGRASHLALMQLPSPMVPVFPVQAPSPCKVYVYRRRRNEAYAMSETKPRIEIGPARKLPCAWHAKKVTILHATTKLTMQEPGPIVPLLSCTPEIPDRRPRPPPCPLLATARPVAHLARASLACRVAHVQAPSPCEVYVNRRRQNKAYAMSLGPSLELISDGRESFPARGTRKKSPFRTRTHDAGPQPDGAPVVLACLKTPTALAPLLAPLLAEARPVTHVARAAIAHRVNAVPKLFTGLAGFWVVSTRPWTLPLFPHVYR